MTDDFLRVLMSCLVMSVSGSSRGSNKAYSALRRTSASQESLPCASPCSAVPPGAVAQLPSGVRVLWSLLGWVLAGMLDAGLAGLAKWPSHSEEKGRLEASKEGCNAGEVTRHIDFFSVIPVTLCMTMCGAIAGCWSGTKKPQLCFLRCAIGSLCGLEQFALNFHPR